LSQLINIYDFIIILTVNTHIILWKDATDMDTANNQRRSQEFDLGGYKWVKQTKQPHKKN